VKRTFILATLVFCAAACAVLLVAGWLRHNTRVVAGFDRLIKGTPNWVVDSWFIRMSPQRAQLMQQWFESGTNAALFGITNNTSRRIRVLPVARFETSDQERDTPMLTVQNYRGVYLAPGEAKTIKVASLPHTGRWRVRFCYACDDGHFVRDVSREIAALISGAPNPSRFLDDFRDSIGFFSPWIEN